MLSDVKQLKNDDVDVECVVLHMAPDGSIVQTEMKFDEAVEKYSKKGNEQKEPIFPDDLEDEDEEDAVADIEEEMHSLDAHISFTADHKYGKLVSDYMEKCDRLMGAVFRKKVISHTEMAHFESRYKHNLEGIMKKVGALYPGLANLTIPLLKAITWQAVSLCRALQDTRRSLAGTTGSVPRERPAKKARVEKQA